MHLLYPLQVDHRRYAYRKIGMLRDVDIVGYDRAVEPLVEQEVDTGRSLFPVRERTRLRAVARRLAGVVDVMPRRRLAGRTELAKRRLQPLQQVGRGTEMAEVIVALFALFLQARS